MLTKKRGALTFAALIALLLAPGGPGLGQEVGPAISLHRGVNLFPWFSLTRDRLVDDGYWWPPYQPNRAVPNASDLANLRQIGIDFVRLPIDPGPLVFFAGDHRATLLRDVAGAIETANKSGLKVIVDLHPNESRASWAARAFIERPDRRADYEVLLEDIARLVDRYDAMQVALELMNEPTVPCGSPDWASMQQELLKKVRAVAPRTTLIVTGSCWSGIEGLLRLPPLSDPNLIYTFHYYEPFFFTHQGATWVSDKAVRFLDGLPWPASAGSQQLALESTKDRLAAADLSVLEKALALAKLTKWILSYFQGVDGEERIRVDIRRVLEWRERHGLRPTQVLLGEFGVLRGDLNRGGAAPEDRGRWISAVRRQTEAAGMPWAYWNYFDRFGLVIDDSTRRFDASIMRALTGN